MALETITVGWAGPSKRDNRYGSLKEDGGQNRWFDVSLGFAQQLRKGQVIQIETQQKPNGFWKARAPQGGGTQQQAPVQPQSGITKDEAMAVMGFIGRAYGGTGTLPGREELTSMIFNIVRSWRDAEKELEIFDQQPHPQEPAPPDGGFDERNPPPDPNDEIPW